MRNILSEFGDGAQSASTLKIDNQSAISVSKNPEHHSWIKLLDLRFYWLRDKCWRVCSNTLYFFILLYMICETYVLYQTLLISQ